MSRSMTLAAPGQSLVVPTTGALLARHRPAALLGLLAFVVLYWPVFVGLARSWTEDPDLSFSFAIPVISAVILVRRRKSLAALAARMSPAGLVAVFLALALFLGSYAGYTNFTQRLAAWGTLVGAIWFTLGSVVLRTQPFPFLFLLFAIPPPESAMSPLRIGLKELATRMAADLLTLFGSPASPLGNILVLGDLRFEVADACSGIRSLLAMLASAAIFAYLLDAGWLKGALLLATAIPVTILVNAVRLVVLAGSWQAWDLDLTTGVRHQLLGYATFAGGWALLYASWRFYDWLLAWKLPRSS
jgi:exosortase